MASASKFKADLKSIELQAVETLIELASQCEKLLEEYEGVTFGSYEQNKIASQALQSTFDFLNLKAVCPKSANL